MLDLSLPSSEKTDNIFSSNMLLQHDIVLSGSFDYYASLSLKAITEDRLNTIIDAKKQKNNPYIKLKLYDFYMATLKSSDANIELLYDVNYGPINKIHAIQFKTNKIISNKIKKDGYALLNIIIPYIQNVRSFHPSGPFIYLDAEGYLRLYRFKYNLKHGTDYYILDENGCRIEPDILHLYKSNPI